MKTVATYCDILSPYLPAITNILRENAVVVAKSISIRCQTKCSHRVEKACGKSTKTTVAKASILLNLFQLFYVHAQLSVTSHHTDRTVAITATTTRIITQHIQKYLTHRITTTH